MKTFCLLLTLQVASLLSFAAETNAPYVIDDGNIFIEGKGGRCVDPQIMAKAKKSSESLPAKDFPEGNWGPVETGYQMSLRFEKSTFTNGEPITAILLMRNVTNENVYLSIDLFPIGFEDGPIGFQVTSADGLPLRQHQYVADTWNGRVHWLVPATQIKYLERLDKRFDLAKGNYEITAIKEARCLPWPKIVNHRPVFLWNLATEPTVKSAPLKIEIN